MISYDPYILIIGFCLLIGLSYIYNLLSNKFNIPSVLFLIFTGIGLRFYVNANNWSIDEPLFKVLEFLGIIGLIMIVLEAAVDLKLGKDKIPVISKSLILAFIILLISAFGIAMVLQYFLSEPFMNAFVYAIPLSVVSSAVLIPSIHSLDKKKQEIMVYESTFSDILGIMLFNFVVFNEASKIISINSFSIIGITILISIVLSYLLVYMFSRINSNTKIFLMIAILALLYSVGKQLHLSSLMIILIFGLVMNNPKLFYFGFFKKLVDFEAIGRVSSDFRIITTETAFIVRTFFFIVFGMSINLSMLLDFRVLGIGSLILIIMYIIRYLNFKIIHRTNVFPEIFLAPRGLITILLFYSIPSVYLIKDFSIGILFFVILMTSVIMMIALILTPNAKLQDITIYNFGVDTSKHLFGNKVQGPFCSLEENSEDIK